MNVRFQTMLGLAVLSCVFAPSRLEAQAANGWQRDKNPQQPQRVPWGIYDPFQAMRSRVYDQAELIRAQGEAAADFAKARKLQTEVRKKELENWEQTVRTQWEMRLLREKKQLELNHAHQIAKLSYLNDQKWKNSRTWEKLKNHPELSTSKIKTGDAQNFLLARLAVSALPYQFDPAQSRYGPEALRELNLNDELLSQITLAQGDFRFTADQPVQEQIDQWPYFLRWKEFDSERTAFEAARQQVVRESNLNGQVSVHSMDALQDALMQLSKEFHFSSRIWDWVKEHRRYTQYNDSVRFLAQLDREIGQLQRTGDIRPFQGRTSYDPAVHGKHIISLLTFMNRNGLKFAPAKPGSEYVYQNLFLMMRAVYLTVADDDLSTQPQNLSERISVK